MRAHYTFYFEISKAEHLELASRNAFTVYLLGCVRVPIRPLSQSAMCSLSYSAVSLLLQSLRQNPFLGSAAYSLCDLGQISFSKCQFLYLENVGKTPTSTAVVRIK